MLQRPCVTWNQRVNFPRTRVRRGHPLAHFKPVFLKKPESFFTEMFTETFSGFPEHVKTSVISVLYVPSGYFKSRSCQTSFWA